MSALVDFADVIDAVERYRQAKRPPLPSEVSEEYGRIAEAVKKTLLREAFLPLMAVQGVPGAGKTTILMNILLGALNGLDARVKLLYTAPTNALVTETLVRVMAILRDGGYSYSEIFKMIRVYGSKIPSEPTVSRLEMVLKKRGINESAADLVSLISRSLYAPIDGETKLILATESQRVSSKSLAESGFRFSAFHDEASRSPLYHLFVPYMDKLVKGDVDVISSLVVVGDPFQAISVPQAFIQSRYPLLAVQAVACAIKNSDYPKQYQQLRYTLRVPKPLHLPIKEGFYSNEELLRGQCIDKLELESVVDVKARLEGVQFDVNRCRSGIRKEKFREICNYLDAAINGRVGLVVVDTMSFPPGTNFDEWRARFALEVLKGLKAGLEGYEGDVLVTAPYTDMVNYIATRAGIERLHRVKVYTVDSVLGGEAPIHIAVLGKEWITQESTTYYFDYPNLLNVQLSRENSIKIIIGDITTLSHAFKKAISYRHPEYVKLSALALSKTANKLIELAKKSVHLRMK